jgi:hypothetical protein
VALFYVVAKKLLGASGERSPVVAPARSDQAKVPGRGLRVVSLGDLRLSVRDERELAWYLRDAPGALGLQSNLGPLTDRLESCIAHHKGSKPVTTAKFYDPGDHAHDVERAHDVEARFGQLEAVDQWTMVAAYGPPQPPESEQAWRWLGTTLVPWAVVLLEAQREEIHRETLLYWRKVHTTAEGKLEPPYKSLLAALRRRADGALVRACRAYTATWWRAAPSKAGLRMLAARKARE